MVMHFLDINFEPSMNTFTLNPTTSKTSVLHEKDRKIWEVYAGKGRTAEIAAATGAQVHENFHAVVLLAGTLTLPVIVFGF